MMDFTPELGQSSRDSACISGSFDTSSICVSTPLTTSTLHVRKRKFSNIAEATPPQFHSTFNDTLITDFRVCDLESTPEKQPIRSYFFTSPAQEQHDILYYNNIKPNVTPKRKILTPKKPHVKPDLPVSSFEKVMRNGLVMQTVLSYLSDGELFRFSQASGLCKQAVMSDRRSKYRYGLFKDKYQLNKENYTITPPCSPQKSPVHQTDSLTFDSFAEVAKELKDNQSLAHCVACARPCIVDRHLRQCQNASCGLIHCTMCGSVSKTGPQDFRDKCGRSTLLYSKLEDISNHMMDSGGCIGSSLYANSPRSFSQDSGISSEGELSPRRVKKNLFGSEERKRTGPLMTINRTVSKISLTAAASKKKRVTSYTPVLTRSSPKRERIIDSPSPPPRLVAAGSTQSKRNLKRLTR